jgi:hypothetical protein
MQSLGDMLILATAHRSASRRFGLRTDRGSYGRPNSSASPRLMSSQGIIRNPSAIDMRKRWIPSTNVARGAPRLLNTLLEGSSAPSRMLRRK